MAVDDLLQGLHADRTLSLEEQLRAIERDLARRHFLGVMTTNTLFDQLRKLEMDILKLLPEYPGAPDVHRRDRVPLEQEARRIQQAIDKEQADRWRDEQELHRERRGLVREHREELQRYTRLGAGYE